MNLQKAIGIGTNYLKGSDETEPVEFDEFVRLGTEALKRLEDIRKDRYPRDLYPLPGETED